MSSQEMTDMIRCDFVCVKTCSGVAAGLACYEVALPFQSRSLPLSLCHSGSA